MQKEDTHRERKYSKEKLYICIYLYNTLKPLRGKHPMNKRGTRHTLINDICVKGVVNDGSTYDSLD